MKAITERLILIVLLPMGILLSPVIVLGFCYALHRRHARRGLVCVLCALGWLNARGESAPVITNLTYINGDGQVVFSRTFPLPPLPPDFVAPTTRRYSPKYKALLDSLGKPMVKVKTAAGAVGAAIFPLPPFMLVWDYPVDQMTNVVFEVYHTETPTNGPPLTRFDQIPSGFSLLSVVDGPPVYVGGLPQEFFIVRARDRISGVVSNWNVK